MRAHRLKVWPQFYAALLDGTKTFEFRKDDRGFAVGDVLHLEEWDPATETHTGRALVRDVTYKLAGGSFGLPEGLCVLALSKPTPEPPVAELCECGHGEVQHRRRPVNGCDLCPCAAFKPAAQAQKETP